MIDAVTIFTSSNSLITLRLIILGNRINAYMKPVDAKPGGAQSPRFLLKVIEHYFPDPFPEVNDLMIGCIADKVSNLGVN